MQNLNKRHKNVLRNTTKVANKPTYHNNNRCWPMWQIHIMCTVIDCDSNLMSIRNPILIQPYNDMFQISSEACTTWAYISYRRQWKKDKMSCYTAITIWTETLCYRSNGIEEATSSTGSPPGWYPPRRHFHFTGLMST